MPKSDLGNTLTQEVLPLLGNLSPILSELAQGVMGSWHHEVTGIQSLLEILSCRSDTLPTNGSSNKLDWPGQSLLCPPSAPGQWHPRPLGAVHGTLGPCLLPSSGAPSHSSELISVCHYLSVQGRRVAGKLPSPWSTPPAGFTHPLENAVRVWGGRHKKKNKIMLPEIFGVGTVYFMCRKHCEPWSILPPHPCVTVCSLVSVITCPSCPFL